MKTHASRRLVTAVAVAAALALTACSSGGGAKASATPPPASTAPSAIVPTVPSEAGTPTSSGSTGAKAGASPTVKQLVHYSVAATHTCSWATTKAGHLTISLGFRITATGKNPPTNVPFTITDGTVTSTAYQPVGVPFQAILDSGKPAAGNAWVGKVITTTVTVNGGRPNAVRATLTLNGPVAKVPNGDTYCPAD